MEKNTFVSTFGKVAYYSSGTGKDIVFLHGWGQDFSCFEKIATALAAEYRVLGIDLPGFGESEIPRKAMSVSDYAAAFKELLDELGITNPVIVAHSFGGRIALNYCAESGAEKLILVSSAGIRKRNFFLRLRVYRYKILKKVYKDFFPKKHEKLIANSGSADYRKSTGVMREILVKAVNHDSRKDMKKINCPAYLFWGLLDEETPYRNGLRMAKLIRGSELITFYNSGHFCFLQEEKRFLRALKKIL